MKSYDDRYRKTWWAGLLLAGSVLAGCRVFPDNGLSVTANEAISAGFNGPPRVRFGSYPSATLGTTFLGPKLGKHGYQWELWEKNGIVYTCRAGHVDIIHLRIAADWTAYLASRTFETLMNDEAAFSYKLAVDRSHSTVRFSYPPNWRQMSEAERTAAATDVAMTVGPYLAFTMTTWHEILTWFGFKCIGLPTEFPSAFSWEDSFSNLLGTIVATRALQDTQHPYNKAVEIAIDEEMQKLGIQPARVAKRASESVRGDWYTGLVLFFVNIKNRNLDIGLDDGMITPTLIPGVTACPNPQPLSYPVPTLDAVSKRGFDVTVEIEPREWERGKIFQVLYGDPRDRRIRPESHIAHLMQYIENIAVEERGFAVAPAAPSEPRRSAESSRAQAAAPSSQGRALASSQVR